MAETKLRPDSYSTLVQRLQIELCSFYSSKLQLLLVRTKDKTEKKVVILVLFATKI